MAAENKDQMAAANRFIVAAKGLRQAIGADIPLQQIMILTYLWQHGRAKQVDLARALDFKIAAASRHCRSLSSYYVQAGESVKQRGQQLILAERNPVATREMRYSLSDRARPIMTTFMATLASAAD